MHNGTTAGVNTLWSKVVNTLWSKEEIEQRTGPMAPAQIAMEKDLGLDPSANLPARPQERRRRANPDNSACSSMEHHGHRRQ